MKIRVTRARTYLWITGRPWVDKPKELPLSEITFTPIPKINWDFYPSGHNDFILHLIKAPNFVYRFTQRVVLGFKWKMK